MRLICPNCDAQYEVDERVIPDAGRDVQCSNCGHAWFQHPEGYVAPAEEAPKAPVPTETPEADEPAAEPGQSTESAIDALTREDPPEVPPEAPVVDLPEEQPSDDGDSDDDGDDGEEAASEIEPEPTPEPAAEPESEQTQQAEPTRRGLKDEVRDVLREEALRESQARKSRPESLETQEELGLSEGPATRELRNVAAQERMARLRGLDTDETSGARRDLLPDIEEINSSLAPIGKTDIVDDFAEPSPKKGGFSRGFFLMLLIAIVVAAAYIYAPVIREKIPAIAPYVDSYVSFVDQARDWLDGMVKLALSKLQSAGA